MKLSIQFKRWELYLIGLLSRVNLTVEGVFIVVSNKALERETAESKSLRQSQVGTRYDISTQSAMESNNHDFLSNLLDRRKGLLF